MLAGEEGRVQPLKIVIMGAAGRDFHNFNVVFRDNPHYQVIAFTAAQIPNIENRRYPAVLAGSRYPAGIPIYPEADLESLIERHHINQVIFSYSDISHEDLMHKASRVVAHGADFSLLGCRTTMLHAHKPVISVCAVRTGAGKSPLARKIAGLLRREGLRVAVLRHPMPYGDLARQVVQRFAVLDDLRTAQCTIEEMEEYEPHLQQGDVVYAGVDYERILRRAELEADILLWDGGNNDYPFIESDLEIVLVDPLRTGHETRYFPGEVNLLRADAYVLTKLDSASPEQVRLAREAIRAVNPSAPILESTMPIVVDRPDVIRDRRVLVIEDGPTLTHGGMSFGAGTLAAKQFGARACVDPRASAVGSLRDVFARHPHIGAVLPAMGYGAEQVRELQDTIAGTACDTVLIATPADLRRILSIAQPTARVTYGMDIHGRPTLDELIGPMVSRARAGKAAGETVAGVA